MGKVQGQPSPPQSIGTSDPVRRPRSPRAFAGVSTSASSNGVSPLAEQVARTYSVPAEEIPPLQKSLYKPGHFDVLPPARSGLDTPSCDQNVQPSTTINTYPESAAPISHPNRVPQLPKTIPNGFPWRLPPGFDPRKLAFRLPDRDPDRAPGLRALLMSNNAPPGHEDWLRFAEADVERFMRCLIQYFNVKVENIRVVKTVQDVRPVSDGFRWLFAGVISGDALILLISSHVQLNGIDDLVQFFHYNAQDFFAYINNLPRGCSLEILLDTCFGTKLIRLEHVVKRMQDNMSTIIISPNLHMGASFPVVATSPPLAENIGYSPSPQCYDTTGPLGNQGYRPGTGRAPRHRTLGISAAPHLAGSGSPTRQPHSHKRPPGPDHAVVGVQPLPPFTLGTNTKAGVTLWAFEAFTSESSEFPGEPARGGVLSNAFCTALEMGMRARSAIWDVVERMTSRENSAQANRDRYKTPEQLARLMKDGPRGHSPHLRSTCSDRNRVLEGEVFGRL